MTKRTQINIRIDDERKAEYEEAAESDKATPDLTAWVKKHCDAAAARFKKRKGNNKKI